MKHFSPQETKITLLTTEQAKKLPKNILACGKWWWLRSPGYYPYSAAYVFSDGVFGERGYIVHNDYGAVRPAFKIANLSSEFGEKVYVGKLLCTVIDKNLVLADKCVCLHRFDVESNDWDTSELKAFVESEAFARRYIENKAANKKVKNVIKGLCERYRLDEISIIDSDCVCYSGSVDGWEATEIDMLFYKKEIENRDALKHMVHNGRKAFIFIGNPCQEPEIKEL